jgi:transcriptional regulator with XRE-family HTH domain
MPVRLGNFIRERRQELGLTQEQLAQRIGDTVRQAEVSRLENNRISLPRRERLAAIAAALEVSLGELLIRTGWMDEGDDLAEAILMPPRAGWAVVDLEELESASMIALVEALSEAEAMVAETTEALEHAKGILASLRQRLQDVHYSHREIQPTSGDEDRTEAATVFNRS